MIKDLYVTRYAHAQDKVNQDHPFCSFTTLPVWEMIFAVQSGMSSWFEGSGR